MHARSQRHLAIYPVSEASNESPEKMSSGNAKRNKSSTLKPDQAKSRGRVSASFYFHANKLSVWQSEADLHDANTRPADEHSQS